MVRFGSLSSQARAMLRLSRDAARFCDSEAFVIDRCDDAADRVGDAFAVEQEIAAAPFDPAGIHDHPWRMKERTDIAEPGLQNTARRNDFGIEGLDEPKHRVGVAARQGGEA